jgi:hypothetical protein
MAGMQTSRKTEAHLTSRWLVVVSVLFGLLLMFISNAFPHEGFGGYVGGFLKELGIVIVAVISVSVLYEKLALEKHQQEFLGLLREVLKESEDNAAACRKLGILKIYPTRDVFELDYPIANWTRSLTGKSSCRIIAKSLFELANKIETFKAAVQKGARVEFCIADPDKSDYGAVVSGLTRHDILAAVSTVKEHVSSWVEEGQPSAGKLEIRYHQLPLFDSFFLLPSLAVWDLSFGRATIAKRIFLLDAKEPLGADLTARYNRIWEASRPVFLYEAGKISLDELGGPEPPAVH